MFQPDQPLKYIVKRADAVMHMIEVGTYCPARGKPSRLYWRFISEYVCKDLGPCDCSDDEFRRSIKKATNSVVVFDAD